MQVRELEAVLAAELRGLGIDARPLVFPTGWDVGPVAAYLFPGDPVTLIDAGTQKPSSREILEQGLADAGLQPGDVVRVIVTHAHDDHYGGAIWLQEASGCEVLLHPADIDVTGSDWRAGIRELFGPLGFTGEMIARFTQRSFEWTTPDFTPLEPGRTFDVGAARLNIEHHPGHTPGHVWVVEESSGAIFVGDYLLAASPTTPGLELDPDHASGRMPLLERYNDGLRELKDRTAAALFPAHGPPITDHAELIDRRLAKSARRTKRVLAALTKAGSSTAVGLARRMYGERAVQHWGAMADLAGRLDLLTAEGRATARMGEDGAWLFEAVR